MRLSASFGPRTSRNAVLLSAQLVVVHEKLFKLFCEFLTQVLDVFHMSMAVIFFLDRHDSVVAFTILFLPLFALDDPDQPTSQQQPGNAGSSISTRTSTGSPRSATVDGINPKS